MDERNLKEKASGGSAIHGITKYADASPDEFTRLLGYRAAAGPIAATAALTINDVVAQTSIRDWTGIYTTPVKGRYATAKVITVSLYQLLLGTVLYCAVSTCLL